MRSHLEKVRDAAKVRRYTEKWFRFSSDPPDTIRWKNNTPFPEKSGSCVHGDIRYEYTPKRRRGEQESTKMRVVFSKMRVSICVRLDRVRVGTMLSINYPV